MKLYIDEHVILTELNQTQIVELLHYPSSFPSHYLLYSSCEHHVYKDCYTYLLLEGKYF